MNKTIKDTLKYLPPSKILFFLDSSFRNLLKKEYQVHLHSSNQAVCSLKFHLDILKNIMKYDLYIWSLGVYPNAEFLMLTIRLTFSLITLHYEKIQLDCQSLTERYLIH